MKTSLLFLLLTGLFLYSTAQEKRYVYYDHSGNKVEVEKLKFNVARLQYKMGEGGFETGKLKATEFGSKKKKKLDPANIKAFVIKEDSFIIVKDLYFEQKNFTSPYTILKVLETGKLNLYFHKAKDGPGGMGGTTTNATRIHETYVFRKEGSDSYSTALIFFPAYKMKDAKATMLKAFEDNPRIKAEASRMSKLSWNMGKVRELAKEYNETSK